MNFNPMVNNVHMVSVTDKNYFLLHVLIRCSRPGHFHIFHSYEILNSAKFLLLVKAQEKLQKYFNLSAIKQNFDSFNPSCSPEEW